ncbi:MAG: hypothetical protein Q4D57_03220 [Clostridia bacterium]|nr:hypothetical protein [Clostridia bacterium]
MPEYAPKLQLLPAIVGYAAGVSGFIGAFEEAVAKTVLWLTSSIGHTASNKLMVFGLNLRFCETKGCSFLSNLSY